MNETRNINTRLFVRLLKIYMEWFMAVKDQDWDFGFSLVDENELKAMETQLAAQNKDLSLTAEEWKDKYQNLYAMIMVLMKNLSTEPSKSYIFWPNRVEKINEFIKKINETN